MAAAADWLAGVSGSGVTDASIGASSLRRSLVGGPAPARAAAAPCACRRWTAGTASLTGRLIASGGTCEDIGKFVLLPLLRPLRLSGSPCLVFHHCMDICASISSIFLSVVARSSGLDGIELWKNEGRAAGSWPAITSLRRILRSMSNSRLRTKSLRRLRSIISLSICLE